MEIRRDSETFQRVFDIWAYLRNKEQPHNRFEKPKSQKGPIYICVDTSGSMEGEPEVIAKTLALAIVIVAQRDCRLVCMINYSHNLSFFILTNLRRQRQKFLSFLSHSYSGGNDENRLFDFIFKKMPDNSRYRQFTNSFTGADILVVSDFEWSYLSDKTIN